MQLRQLLNLALKKALAMDLFSASPVVLASRLGVGCPVHDSAGLDAKTPIERRWEALGL